MYIFYYNRNKIFKEDSKTKEPKPTDSPSSFKEGKYK